MDRNNGFISLPGSGLTDFDSDCDDTDGDCKRKNFVYIAVI